LHYTGWLNPLYITLLSTLKETVNRVNNHTVSSGGTQQHDILALPFLPNGSLMKVSYAVVLSSLANYNLPYFSTEYLFTDFRRRKNEDTIASCTVKVLGSINETWINIKLKQP
jgi:hypothetical protein